MRDMALKGLLALFLVFCLVEGSVIKDLKYSSAVTADWDRELEIPALGLHLKIKYNDLANIFNGGRIVADFKIPKMLTSMTMGVTDLQMDAMVTGTDILKSIFDVKVAYRMTRNAVVKEGTVEFARAMIENEFANKLVVKVAYRMTRNAVVKEGT